MQEKALAEEEQELHQVMTRERQQAEARSPVAPLSVVDSTASNPGVILGFTEAPRPVTNGADEQQVLSPPPPLGEEKLWSDSDSDVYDDGGVEESKLSAPPAVDATALKNVVAGEGMDATGEGRAANHAEAAAAAVAADTVPDLLVNGGYVDIESANPPALSDWIAHGAAETRDVLATGKKPQDEQRLHLPQSNEDVGQHARLEAPLTPAEKEPKDIDEDSFCSNGGGGIGDSRGGGIEDGNSSDADSEARLTALVARVAVRGEESRAALIVQALVRGRAARKFAAAERGRECAREEAEATKIQGRAATAAAAGAAVPPSPATTAGDGFSEEAEGGLFEEAGPAADMAWLAQKERRQGLSDSFASSDSGGGGGAGLLVRHSASYLYFSRCFYPVPQAGP